MDMVCIVFSDKQKADGCLALLRSLHNQELFELDDACVATRDESGKVHLEQAFPQTGMGIAVGAVSGMAWGLMAAFLYSLNSAVGTAAGTVMAATAAGAIAGKFIDYGIDDKFIKHIAEELQPGTSAIFVLFGTLESAKVLPHLRQFDGKVLTSTLPPERVNRLRAALAPEADQKLSSQTVRTES